jgi:hypothetical protein
MGRHKNRGTKGRKVEQKKGQKTDGKTINRVNKGRKSIRKEEKQMERH